MILLLVLFQDIQFSSSTIFHLLCCDDLSVLGELQVLTKDWANIDFRLEYMKAQESLKYRSHWF